MRQTKAELRQLVLDRLSKSGFTVSDTLSVGSTKDAFRKVHRLARRHEIATRRDHIKSAWNAHRDSFASWNDVIPSHLEPRLEVIKRGDDTKNELFWLARMYWSIPYSQGYGRRLRCLVWDNSTGKLMGIVGLQSPPLDFKVRDSIFQYPQGMKTALVNQMMDGHSVGGIPPFSFLLAGKLAAMTLGCNEVRNAYARRYAGSVTHIEHRVLPARLVAITTTSAFGKSSLYDRVRDRDGTPILKSLGTINETYGSYQFNGVYRALREHLLVNRRIKEYHGFGVGPRIRWQVIRKGLREIGLSPDLLRHNVPREVFLVSHLWNLEEYLSRDQVRPRWIDRPFASMARFWTDRWSLPRWERIQATPSRLRQFKAWDRRRLIASILNA